MPGDDVNCCASPEKVINHLSGNILRIGTYSLGGNTVGRTWAGTGHSQQVGVYTVMTLKCTAPVGEHTSVFVMVDNLLNRHYEVLAGYPLPGANAAGGFTLRF